MIGEEQKMKQNFPAQTEHGKRNLYLHTHTHSQEHLASHTSSPAQTEFCQ